MIWAEIMGGDNRQTVIEHGFHRIYSVTEASGFRNEAFGCKNGIFGLKNQTVIY